MGSETLAASDDDSGTTEINKPILLLNHFLKVPDPVRARDYLGSPDTDSQPYPERRAWTVDGEVVLAAYSHLKDDDDWDQVGALIREILDDDGRQRLISNLVDYLKSGVSQIELDRVIKYWCKADQDIGEGITERMKNC